MWADVKGVLVLILEDGDLPQSHGSVEWHKVTLRLPRGRFFVNRCFLFRFSFTVFIGS